MVEALPETMVASLEAMGADLVAWARAHRGATLGKHEVGVLEIVRRVLPELLGEVVEMSTPGLDGRHAPLREACPGCGERRGAQSWRERTVLTVCGPVQIERPWYTCAECRSGFSPVDTALGLAPRGRLSVGMVEWLVHLGATTAFRDAAQMLERLTGLTVAAETIRQRTEKAGAAIETEIACATAVVAATGEPSGPVDPAPGTLVIETDGVMVRYGDGWHEVKLGLIAGHQGGTTVVPSYIAARAGAEQFGPRLLAEAARRGALAVVGWDGPLSGRNLAVLRTVLVLGDGAIWIWALAAEHFGTRIEVIDFYHAAEHVWTVARALFGEGTVAATAWANARIKELLATGADPARRAMATATATTPEAVDVLRRERGYFRTNAHRMNYPAFRAQGLPIGSGAIESCAKHLVQHRMKRPGARWSQPGAQAVLNVRCRLLSNLPIAA